MEKLWVKVMVHMAGHIRVGECVKSSLELSSSSRVPRIARASVVYFPGILLLVRLVNEEPEADTKDQPIYHGWLETSSSMHACVPYMSSRSNRSTLNYGP